MIAAAIRRLTTPTTRTDGTPAARRRVARAVMIWVAAAYCVLNPVAFVVIDSVHTGLRDPEYGQRADSLRQRLAENPGRPLVVVVGSSRAAMGVCPQVWEDIRPRRETDPMLFNMSRVGGGPLMNLMTLRRLYADGFRPAAVVVEFWPPLLREEGAFREADRIDAAKLYAYDLPFVRSYLANSEEFERQMLTAKLNPVYSHRRLWLRRLFPAWLPRTVRVDGAVRPLDPWGWLPGLDEGGLRRDTRSARLANCEGIYRNQLADLRIDPAADRAIREAVALASEHGAEVAFAFLPESTEFRGWYTPEAERLGRAYLDVLCQDLRVPVIDARRWLADPFLADGFHATRSGAEEFTRKFGREISVLFPHALTRDAAR